MVTKTYSLVAELRISGFKNIFISASLSLTLVGLQYASTEVHLRALTSRKVRLYLLFVPKVCLRILAISLFKLGA